MSERGRNYASTTGTKVHGFVLILVLTESHLFCCRWVPKGLVVHANANATTGGGYYEHSSIAASMHNMFDTASFLNARDAGKLGVHVCLLLRLL